MKRFSKKGYGEEAICPTCGQWKTTDFSPAELKEREWECTDCANKRLTQPETPPASPKDRGSEIITKYDPEYKFLVTLVKLVTSEGVSPQEIKDLTKAYPFETVDDVGDLTAKIWTLATEKYKIPREWLISRLPKNASLKVAHCGPCTSLKMEVIKQFSDLKYKDKTQVDDSVLEDLSRLSAEADIKPFLQRMSEAREKIDAKKYADIIEKLYNLSIALSDIQEKLDSGTITIDKSSNKKADLWPAQEQAQDMLSHEHNSLSYNNDQEPDTSVSGPRPDEVGKQAESLNIDQIVQILNAKDTNKVIRIDPKNLRLELSDGTEISFDDAAKKAMDIDKTATGEFTGAEFSGTDAEPNPLTDIGPWSSPEDQGKKPQKSPFPNTNWLPADDENKDEQPASNVAASLKKEAIQQQDVVDFYLLSLLPPEYLNQEVSPEHYDALAIFKHVIETLRNEYIERGMEELVDEAETTAWTKAIPESDMPEEIKKYYTFHDTPFPGRNYTGDPDDEDSEPDYDYTCDNCGMGLDEYDVMSFRDGTYCSDCETTAIKDAIKEDVAYCTTHHVFVTDADDLKDYLHGYKFDEWDNHQGDDHNIVRFDEGKKIWNEVLDNAEKQIRFRFEERQRQREEAPHSEDKHPMDEVCSVCQHSWGEHKGTKCPVGKGNFKSFPKQKKLRMDDGTAPNQLGGDDDPIPGPTASLKQAGEGRYMGGDSDGWWEAPTNFGDYTALDFYTIFEHAPWKHLYGGPAWAEIAKTIYQMQQTTDWQKLVVLIDHFHDLGHNTGKLLDKFPEWHQWFRKLLDEKAKKNSIRYLLPKASKPVQNLVTDFLKVHGRDWREDENKGKPKQTVEGGWEVGDHVLVENPDADIAKGHKRFHPATIIEIETKSEYPYHIQYDNGATDWVHRDNVHSPDIGTVSSLRRPFSKKASPDSRYWIAPDGTEFPVSGIHPVWILNNGKILKKYGINPKQATYEIHNQMMANGWSRISTEGGNGHGFQIEIADLNNIPPYLDDFVAKHFQQGDEILIGNGKEKGVFLRDPFPSLQKAVNKERTNPRYSSLREAAISGQITNKILQTIHNNGGITYNLTNGDMSGTPNYAVSIYPDRERIVDGIDFDILEGFIDDNEDLLKDPANSLGAWTHDGKVYLGISVTISDRMKAVELAKQNNQIAIWDLQNNKEISIGSSDKVAYQAKRLWVDPNGKQYDVSKSWSHADWILDNKEMLKNDYDTDIGYKYQRGQDGRVQNWEEANAELISMGWSRVGDVRGETAYGIQVADIMNIPSYIVDILTEGGSLNGTIILEDNNGKWVKIGLEDLVNEGQNAITHALQTNRLVPAFSKKYLIKTAEESVLPQDAQNAIAAASSPAYVMAVNNYAEALKRGHSKDRSLEYAVESVQNLEKLDPKKLVEFINKYVVI
jgi:hypothetical protein